jgi:hypothetical protein
VNDLPFPENYEPAPKQAEGNEKHITPGKEQATRRAPGPENPFAIQQPALKGSLIHYSVSS